MIEVVKLDVEDIAEEAKRRCLDAARILMQPNENDRVGSYDLFLGGIAVHTLMTYYRTEEKRIWEASENFFDLFYENKE